jgi:ATP-dependent DNA ligase
MVRRRIRTDGFVDPCVPTLAAEPPSGPDWIHEIEHDDYRLIVRRAARPCGSLPCAARSFTLDGEAVPVGADGVAIFDALHRRHKATDAMLCAFDLLAQLAQSALLLASRFVAAPESNQGVGCLCGPDLGCSGVLGYFRQAASQI